ncbi:MAG TPA: magnesium/cobalt transporter CorA [Longimicrobium sp.]|nr:magnesium/cobalt transporter CorA [Longimicrobium sp.]
MAEPLGRRDLFRLPLQRAAAVLEPVVPRPRPEPGSEPGALASHADARRPTITVIAYGPHELTEAPVDDLELLRTMRGRWPVLWVNVDGVAHGETLRAVGEVFGLHPLALEDLGDVQQRAKVEEYPDHLFVVARMARLAPDLDLEQIGIFLGRDYVLTFQERPGDPLDTLRQRIRASRGRLRTGGPDYLAYAVLDAIVDHYFPVAEAYADRLDALEDEVLGRPSRGTMPRLHAVKRDLMALRRAAWPLRDALAALVREPGPLVSPGTVVYFRDTQDHAFQILDLLETYRELAGSLTDLYLGNQGRRANEIMKVLTVFAALFIPLGFITGVYGMNVPVPPGWWWTLSAALGAMAATALLLLLWFARKRWLGDDG